MQLEMDRKDQLRQDNHINFYIIQCEQNPFTCKVFCRESGGLFGRKSQTTSREKQPVWQCNNLYKFKDIQSCANRNIDEETLQQSFLRALEIPRENKKKSQEKWDDLSEEKSWRSIHAIASLFFEIRFIIYYDQ